MRDQFVFCLTLFSIVAFFTFLHLLLDRSDGGKVHLALLLNMRLFCAVAVIEGGEQKVCTGNGSERYVLKR